MNRTQLSVTQSLIIINIIVFVVGLAVQKNALLCIAAPWSPEKDSVFHILGAYSWFTCFSLHELWRLVSYQFVHAGAAHLIFNMWALYFFGSNVERDMGGRRFLLFYLVCGVAGALFSSALASAGFYCSVPETPNNLIIVNQLAQYVGYDAPVQVWQMIPMVGASASIYGVLVAAAFLYPGATVSLILPPVTLTVRALALWIIAIASVTILFNLSNAGGEAGHLGGVIMGALIMWIWRYRSRGNYR